MEYIIVIDVADVPTLRRLLKSMKRQFGAKCLRVVEAPPGEDISSNKLGTHALKNAQEGASRLPGYPEGQPPRRNALEGEKVAWAGAPSRTPDTREKGVADAN